MLPPARLLPPLAAALFVVAHLAAGQAAEPAGSPNIILIMADDK